jgi:hypothetical protein
MIDGVSAKRPERAGHFQMRNHDHHAQQEGDRVEVDCAKGFLEAQGTDRNHCRAAEKGDAGAVETQAGNAANGDAQIGQDEDDERGEVFGSHSTTIDGRPGSQMQPVAPPTRRVIDLARLSPR